MKYIINIVAVLIPFISLGQVIDTTVIGNSVFMELNVSYLDSVLRDLENRVDLLQSSVVDSSNITSPSESYAFVSSLSPNHGVLYIPADTNMIFVVPDSVYTLELNLVGGRGGDGGNTSEPSQNPSGQWAYGCPHNGRSGGSGGNGGKFRALIMCAPGDTFSIITGENGQDGNSPTGWCHDAGNGTDGEVSLLQIEGQTILTANPGSGGQGAICGCGANGSAYGSSGAHGTISLDQSLLLQSGVIVLESSEGGGGINYIRY